MSELKDTITVRVNVKITPESLKTIVENAKKDVGMDQRGVYRVDTAGKVDEMISQFLLEKDFESYVKDTKNYKSLAIKNRELH
ncbi:MAG: hypothetical protein DRP28_01595 [Thermodesulfobacteriota bacterium]|nr:MAG: hypothetical protein DRP28_01595 [Thermodesulfobacteriota bacterium]